MTRRKPLPIRDKFITPEDRNIRLSVALRFGRKIISRAMAGLPTAEGGTIGVMNRMAADHAADATRRICEA